MRGAVFLLHYSGSPHVADWSAFFIQDRVLLLFFLRHEMILRHGAERVKIILAIDGSFCSCYDRLMKAKPSLKNLKVYPFVHSKVVALAASEGRKINIVVDRLLRLALETERQQKAAQ